MIATDEAAVASSSVPVPKIETLLLTREIEMIGVSVRAPRMRCRRRPFKAAMKKAEDGLARTTFGTFIYEGTSNGR